MIYFIPNHASPQVTADDLRAKGLGHAVHLGNPSARQTTRGPGDVAGVLCGYGRTTYEPDSQQWRNCGGYWIGMDVPQPGPDELKRASIISGYGVKLRDGKEWTIPVCRSIVRGATLPQELVLGDDGKTWQLATLPEFVQLCHDAERVWRFVCPPDEGTERESLPVQLAAEICVRALAVNYRLGPVEVAMLRLLGTDETSEIFGAMVDCPALIEAAKKKTATD